MDSQTVSNSSSTQNQPPLQKPTSGVIEKFKNLSQQKKMLLIGGAVLIIVLVVLFLLLQRQQGQEAVNQSTNAQNNFSPINATPPENAIAKAGDEFIYQRDLDVELANYVGVKDDNAKKILIEKLIKDSIVLQAARKEKLATASAQTFDEIYNLDNKNYSKRFAELRGIEKKLEDEVPRIKGTMISVWFYNMYPAKIGLEAGKAEAFKRISALHQRVKSGEITIEQAGNILKNDPSLSDIDAGYMVNALIPFTKIKGEQITFDTGFDELLRKTNPGEITEVYLAKTVNEFSNENTEAFYVFGQVTEKTNGTGEGFTKWYDAQKGNYEVIYY